LITRVNGDVAKLQAEKSRLPIPVDLVTTSASGLDPDITPRQRNSRSARGGGSKIPEAEVARLVAENSENRNGSPGRAARSRLELNIALDARYGRVH